jgi:alpha-beta hydrolase superfamily lysophospholipase
MTQAVIRRVEDSFDGADGSTRLRRAWLPPNPERALILVHGLAEHCGRYEHLGAWFAARGCAVHAFDLAGHGRSAGVRCHIRRFGDFHDDLDALLALVRTEHPGLPNVLVGHSMGGLIAASFLVERQPELCAAVLSAAALALAADAPRGRLRVGRALRTVAPRLAVSIGLDPEGLSRDPEVVRAYRDDPLVSTRITMSLAAEVAAAIERTAPAAAQVAVPLLLLHGEADPICPVEGSRSFFSGLRVEERALKTYPGLRHEIFNEPEGETIFADALDWIRKRR